MKIKLKSVEEVYTNNHKNGETREDTLCFIPESMFGTTIEAKVYKDFGFGIKNYMSENSYMIPSEFVEEVIDD